jgi:hypothetical protein
MATSPVYYDYNVLVAEIQTFAQRNDQKFIDQIPVFIANAENRLALMIKNLGQLQVVTQDPATQIFSLPQRWHVTTSINITNTETGETSFLLERTLEFAKMYQSELSDLMKIYLPQFYANYDFDHIILTPWLPDLASNWKIEMLYYQRPLPLSESNTQNWWTSYAPQALLYACLREVYAWNRQTDKIIQYEQLLQAEVSNINREDQSRIADRSYSTGSIQ